MEIMQKIGLEVLIPNIGYNEKPIQYNIIWDCLGFNGNQNLYRLLLKHAPF